MFDKGQKVVLYDQGLHTWACWYHATVVLVLDRLTTVLVGSTEDIALGEG